MFTERPDSRRTSKLKLELSYCARNSDSPDFVRAFARQFAPNIVPTAEGNIYQQDVEVMPRSKWIMDVRIQYGPAEKIAGSLTWGASCTAGTVHVQAGISHVARYPDTAVDHKGLINVDGQEVHGTDIVTPVAQRWIEFTHPMGAFTWAMADRLDNLVGCVNSKPFMNKKAGEILFMGYSGTDGSNKEASVRYEVAISRNRQGFQISDIAVAKKEGHDLLWMTFQPKGGGALPGRKVIGVYIERMYERVDLAAQLGFGG